VYLDDAVKEVLEKNMTRGVVYTYIIPDSEWNRPYVDEFNKSFAAHGAKAILQKVSVPEFDRIAAANYIIVNPECSERYPIRMFLELPIAWRERYWIEVDAEAAVKFVARFRRYASGQAGERDQPSPV
jgi:hypothetical protein